jgi:amino acid adenylation domain-containing protein
MSIALNPPADTSHVYAHELIASHTRLRADAPAIHCEGMTLSFRELDERANRLAHRLRALGVGPEVLVGLCVTRSIDLVVGILGILKAGGAYVPLDPAYPAPRLAFMLRDAQARVLLTQEHLLGVLPEVPVATLCLDRDWPSVALEPSFAPTTPLNPSNLAYVIYTSGSTGTPKGVLVPHAGLRNLIEEQIRVFGLGHDSRVLQFASSSFDASVSEILTTLAAGGVLYLASSDELLPGPPLLGRLRKHAITEVTLPPSVLSVLPSADLPALRTVVAAGEASTPAIVARWAAGRRFVNAYGPTEATVCATMAACTDDGRTPPLGLPLANVTVHVLDEALRPVPNGAEGELYIGGVGVARGYLGRPDLTAERFIPDPFADRPGSRLYRTGDAVRLTRDEELEFVGRVDEQVKIRGFRVEPGEIEVALSSHPAVQQAVVVPHTVTTGDVRLVAYVVASAADSHGRDGLPDLLRQHLTRRLPGYMIPNQFVLTDAVLLGPNGKVDRAALAAAALPAVGSASAPPPDLVEHRVSEVFRDVLGAEAVGVDDDFFALGGHSLLATQVIFRLREAFAVDLPLRDLFDGPTAGALATSIRTRLVEGQDGADQMKPIVRQPRPSDGAAWR